MIEEYGSLSEEELLQEIQKQLDSHAEIDASELEFKFEGDRLMVTGNLQTEEEYESLVHILEDYMDPKDYSMEVEVVEGAPIEEEYKERFQEEEEEEELDELEEFDEDEMGEEEEEEYDEDEFDDDKW